MADPVLHIKDSYYFEVPKLLYPYEYTRREQFPDVWISLDPEYQDWEAERVYKELHVLDAGLPSQEKTLSDWRHWAHADHANFAKPLKEFLNEKYAANIAQSKKWKADAEKAAQHGKDTEALEKARKLTFDDYLAHLESDHVGEPDYIPFLKWRHAHAKEYERATHAHDVAGSKKEIQTWRDDKDVPEWSEAKIHAYNAHLSGKILIPQPFATLRNLYEKNGEWYDGFAISKYLIIEMFIGLVLILLFSRLAARIERGTPPKGKFWNLLEVFLVFIRDQIARPVLGSHDHGHDHGHEESGDHGRAEHSHEEHGYSAAAHAHSVAAHAHSVAAHAHSAAAHAHKAAQTDPATRFVPLLWTIFFFVLGCNLMGMVPWAGTPTAAFGVTLAMAAVTFCVVVFSGMVQFGVGGFFLNQVPGMDLPWYMAIIIKPMILVIELLGLCIKHGVLAVRLLANMVAGHLVLLAIMGFAFSAEAAATFAGPGSTWQWGAVGLISLAASAALSCLELFVAFLQAYIFTFLTALFIGAAIHKH